MKFEVESSRNKESGWDVIGVLTLDGIECFQVDRWSENVFDPAVRDEVIAEMDYFVTTCPTFYPRKVMDVKGRNVVYKGIPATVSDFLVPKGLVVLHTSDGVKYVEVHDPGIEWFFLLP